MSADINMNSHQLTNLAAPTTSGNAIRQTSNITEANLEKAINMRVTVKGYSTYTIGANDANSLIRQNFSSACTVTIPSGLLIPIGTKILIERFGTGAVTISPASGVTLLSYNNYRKIKGRYGVVTLIYVSSNTWLLFGDLTS